MIYVDTIFDAPIPASEAEDTINWWIETAAGEIEYQTGIPASTDALMEKLADMDWLYLSENDDGVEMIDMQIAEDCLNDITYQWIRDLKDTLEEIKAKTATQHRRMPK